MSKLEKIKEAIKEKVDISDEEFNGIVKEETEFINDLIKDKIIPEITEERKIDMIANKVLTTLKKKFIVDVETYIGYVFSVSDISDFGADKKKKTMEEKYKLSDELLKEDLIEKGLVSREGIALWCEENTKMEWKWGKPIEPDKEKQRNLIGFFYDEKDERKTFRKSLITLSNEQKDIEIPLRQLCKAKFKGKFNDEGDVFFLNSRSITKFTILDKKTMDYSNCIDMIKKCVKKEEIMDMSNEEQGFSWLNLDPHITYFFIEASPNKSTETNNARNNVVELNDQKEYFRKISAWIPKRFKLPAEGVGNCFIIGRFSMKENDITINANCLYSDVDNEEIIAYEEERVV